jgi:hypothetical protein
VDEEVCEFVFGTGGAARAGAISALGTGGAVRVGGAILAMDEAEKRRREALTGICGIFCIEGDVMVPISNIIGREILRLKSLCGLSLWNSRSGRLSQAGARCLPLACGPPEYPWGFEGFWKANSMPA